MERHPTRLLALAAACLGAFCAVMFAAYFVEPFARWDATALHEVRAVALSHPRLGTLGRLTAQLADPLPVVLALGGIVAVGLASRRRLQALGAVLIVAIAAVVGQALKLALAHPRYQPVLGPLQLPDTAFPSGHATMAMAVTLAALLVVPRRWRPQVAVCGAGLVAAVSVALVADGWHYPSDVLGGLLLATAVTLVVLAGVRFRAAAVTVAPRRFA